MITLFLCILTFLLGILCCFLFNYRKLKTINHINEEIEQQNKKLEEKNCKLNQTFNKLIADIDILKIKREEVSKSIILMEEQAKHAGEIFFEQSKQIAEKEFENSTERMRNEYAENKKQCEEEYLELIKSFSAEAQSKIENYNSIIALLEKTIADQTSIANATTEANKRALEEISKQDFYKIQLSDVDKTEIEKLRSIIPYLRNEEPLNKIIWKTYYEKPTTDLIGRVVGANTKIGIYKITNLNNKMCYIGQSVNIADRFKTHIKAGLGIDSSNNKLYTAMNNEKVENFSFEILEECERSQLNEKEKFWIKYYQSETFGYNMTRGNK